MISGGTTCFADMYFFPEEVAEIAQQYGMRAVIGLMVMDFPTAWGSGPDEYFAKGLEVHDDVRSLSLINTMLTPHAPYTVSDEPLRKTLTYADELQIPMQMHIHETTNETREAEAADGIRPLQRLHELGLLNPRMTAVHMTDLTDGEVELVRQQGVHVVHCPNSNAKLASGQCRVVDLLNAGINVALGTDGAASNNNLDMLQEMRSAALMSKLFTGDAEKLTAWQALEMATINGAKAFNLQDQVGSLKKGKSADLCAIDLNHVATQPVYDPVSQLVYSANRDQVSDVWIDGKRVLQQGKLQTLDNEKILERAQQWGAKINTKHATA
jgi:5-methylthioadenosine/S-adenosylhomocysteine deaminase